MATEISEALRKKLAALEHTISVAVTNIYDTLQFLFFPPTLFLPLPSLLLFPCDLIFGSKEARLDTLPRRFMLASQFNK